MSPATPGCSETELVDGKFLARIGAAIFVGFAIALTIVQLREEPAAPEPEVTTVFELDGDPLPAQLRICGEMGELALSSPDCRAAWAEKRRRFFGVDYPSAFDNLDNASDQALPVTDLPAPNQPGED